MSKKSFKKAVRLNRVMAIPGRQVKNSKGEVVKQLYNIVKCSVGRIKQTKASGIVLPPLIESVRRAVNQEWGNLLFLTIKA